MNVPNTHTQLPENLIVVDREKLEARISEYLEKINSSDISKEWKSKYEAKLVECHSILSECYPFTPLAEDICNKMVTIVSELTDPNSGTNFDKIYDEQELLLSQPITLKKK
jgi:hypothetical protein